MTPVHELGTIEYVFLLLGAAIVLTYVARRIRIAEPIVLLGGGILIGFLPSVPQFQPDPDLVFLLFLPPILFSAAYFTPIRDFRANMRPILLLAIGLVLFTTLAVGLVVIGLVPGIQPAVAFTLGAIVAPPDAVSATAIFRRLGVPRRIVTILEGESLINDASSLIAYRTSIAVVATGVFSLVQATGSFVVVSVGGIAVGLVVGTILARALSRTAEPLLEIIVTLVAPFTAYVVAEAFGFSGVLATVVAGLITGRRAARVLSPEARLLGRGAWGTTIWVINALVFTFVGLQLHQILLDLSEYTAAQLLWLGVAVGLTVIVARIVWVYPATYLPRFLSAKIRARDPYPSPRAVFIVAWAGMRGVVSLAAALALPVDFPQRDLLLYLAFAVIVATLVGQGLSLPWLIRRLGVVGGTDDLDHEELHARLAAADAARARLEELEIEYPGHLELIDQLRAGFDHESSHVWQHEEQGPNAAEQELIDHRAIRSAVLLAEREAVIGLRDEGIINDETLRRVELDLDLEALRTGA
jgi:CPA1 family monovalent cation:H+ antiporter